MGLVCTKLAMIIFVTKLAKNVKDFQFIEYLNNWNFQRNIFSHGNKGELKTLQWQKVSLNSFIKAERSLIDAEVNEVRKMADHIACDSREHTRVTNS